MTNIKGTTRAQTIFLRSFRNPKGPPPDAWPSPAILRRWLRRPSFRAALASIRNSMRFRADIELAQAAAHAASALTHPDSSDPDLCPLTSALSILRLSHIRQRFIDDQKDLPVVVTDNRLFRQMCKMHPEVSLNEALEFIASGDPQLEKDLENSRQRRQPGAASSRY